MEGGIVALDCNENSDQVFEVLIIGSSTTLGLAISPSAGHPFDFKVLTIGKSLDQSMIYPVRISSAKTQDDFKDPLPGTAPGFPHDIQFLETMAGFEASPVSPF
ncbi:hypothetical protein VTN31DRAFT_2155 [Thermomyces dupontii]|uniref:uncharacterized protein n=1 Tax=Talaromyces thermophilus TaxID=28565 RepID=UPI003741EA8B